MVGPLNKPAAMSCRRRNTLITYNECVQSYDVKPQDQRGYAARSIDDPVETGVSGIPTDPGFGVSG
jgi:hypothetical protein